VNSSGQKRMGPVGNFEWACTNSGRPRV